MKKQNKLGFFDYLFLGATATTVAFVILRIVGVLGWAWWWLVSPLWIGFALLVLFMLVVTLASLIIVALIERS